MNEGDRIVPAPWRLTGQGYVIALSCSAAFGAACGADTPGLAGRACGGLGALMLIDYAGSDVGPYRELLLCPGVFDFGDRRAAAITHIWVSSDASVVNGRHNWGLPKERANFETLARTDRAERCRIQRPGRAPITLHLSRRGPKLPLHSAILPRASRTLEQPWRGRRYRTCIRARARARLARLEAHDIPPDSGFPDITGQTPRLGLHADRFDLVFPKAQRQPMDSDGPGSRTR
ncbi:acetoacetate decarboxylase family protein [Salinisphaera orenii]|uniref:Acetoacetate decarboxylase n=1 Tax=Salinisphaera orenii YIM 95161 TaxID=1051139 RepID=A0A423PLE1_9GAMM|nr:acetoacetate decarboxylase family protein [Salinisphaera halophila]ROO26403.1 hypothetical protein SAHL_13010 [Salinisphaera halophila YIM 95161]